MKKASLLFLLICSSVLVMSQDSPSVIVSDFTVQFGGGGGENGVLDDNDLLILAPNAGELYFPENAQYNSNFYDRSDSYSFNAMLGLQFAKKGTETIRNNPTLRIGLSYQNVIALNSYRSASETYRVDTLISSQTGQSVYVDSISTRSLSSEYRTERLKVDASLLFRTTQGKKLTFFAGAGLSAGISFNNRTEVYASQYSTVENQDIYFDYENNGQQRVSNSNKGGLAMSAYIPLGFDYRLSKSHPVWSQIHLNFEMRPSIEIYDIPELKTYSTSEFHGLFGLRFEVGQLL